MNELTRTIAQGVLEDHKKRGKEDRLTPGALATAIDQCYWDLRDTWLEYLSERIFSECPQDWLVASNDAMYNYAITLN